MVEPLFRFDGQANAGETITLDGPEGHHAASVRRLRVGEKLQLTNGVSTHWRGAVVAVSNKSIDVEISEAKPISKPEQTFILVQALAKGDRDELAIQAATEIGVSGVIPWQSDRSVSKWDDSKATKNQARWQSICDEASKQALRPLFVQVGERRTSNQLAQQVGESESKWLVLDPTATKSITAVSLQGKSSVYLVVGPEGGITEKELEAFEASGAERVHLGAGVLRTSTAGVAALSYLSGVTGVWE